MINIYASDGVTRTDDDDDDDDDDDEYN